MVDISHLCAAIKNIWQIVHNTILMKTATKFVHAGVEPDPSTGAIMTPIYQTSTYVQAAPGKHKGYEYARSQNPTRKALEDALAVIENGKYGLSFSDDDSDEDLRGKLAAFYARRSLTQSPVEPEDQAEAIFLLISKRLSKTTGHVFPVDGGLQDGFMR